MNPLILDLGQARIRHASRTQPRGAKRSWSAAESIRLAIEELTEELPNVRRSPLGLQLGWDLFAHSDFSWWPLVSGGGGRQFFGGVRPSPDLSAEPPLPEFPFASDPPFRLNIEDYYQVLHRGWPTLQTEDIRDVHLQAIATLANHAYFQSEQGIGYRTRSFQLLEVIVFHHEFWLRSVSGWTPPDGNSFTCIADLFAHLFFRYDVPEWLDPRGGPADREWDDPNWFTLAVFTGRGGSLHEGLAYLAMDRRGLPLLNRRGVQQFTAAPRELSFWDAVRYALVLNSGGDLAAVHDFQAFGDRVRLPFAAPVVRALAPWLARNRKGISPGMGVLIIHWAHAAYRAYQRRRVDAAFGAHHRTPPRTFTLGRRSLRSVTTEIITQIADYRNPLCIHMVHHTWPAHGWDRTLTLADVEWTARELCTVGDLAREGTEMRHCAVQCLAYCATENTAVVSLFSSEGDRVTLEICPATLDLRQIRGPANRDPFLAEQIAAETWRQQIRNRNASGVHLMDGTPNSLIEG